MTEIIAHIIAFLIYAFLILGGLGLIVGIAKYFYYRGWRSDSVKIYYDDNDHRKGYYIVKRPRGPYPVGYPKEQIVKDMEEFEQLKREQKEKARNHGHRLVRADFPFEIPEDKVRYDIASKPRKPRPMWIQILLMTPAEYLAYRRKKRQRPRP